jgi:glycerol-3-phosphate dehydrogenase
MSAAGSRVAVIGGGVVGCAVAHALARRGVPALLLEAQAQLTTGASATNSGILHTGFDSHPGELETRLILRAAQLRPELLDELGLEVWRCGARLSPCGEPEREAVAALAVNARTNGVEAVLERDGSLRVPGETVSDPLAFVQALAGAAEAGGAEVRLGARVVGLAAGSHADGIEVMLSGGELLRARAAVNCAGLFADALARAAGDELPAIYPRKGEFLVFEPPRGQPPLEQILLPVPSSMGKGVLVFPTLDRRFVIAGPTAREREDKGDWTVEPDAHALIFERALAIHPPLAQARHVDAYAGLRTAGRGGANYLIERSCSLPGLVHVAAIRSTGLSAAPAIGELVAEMLAQDGLVELSPPRALRPRRPLPGHGGLPWWRWGASHRTSSGRAP